MFYVPVNKRYISEKLNFRDRNNKKISLKSLPKCSRSRLVARLSV